MRKYFYLILKKKEDNVPLTPKICASSSILEGEYQIEETLFKGY
ncbi:hypothetical protein [Bacillus cereus]|nr:hypothetical protein [Bacillus cereus]